MKKKILKFIIVLVVVTTSIASSAFITPSSQVGDPGVVCASSYSCEVNYSTKFDDQLNAIACCERYNYGTTGYLKI